MKSRLEDVRVNARERHLTTPTTKVSLLSPKAEVGTRGGRNLTGSRLKHWEFRLD